MFLSNTNWARLLCLLIPNIGGWAGAVVMINQVSNKAGNAWYQIIRKPKWTPPNYIFGPVWTVIYTAMGYAFYLVYTECDGFTDKIAVPFLVFAVQLLVNWTWTATFFKFHLLGWATIHLLLLDVLVIGQTVYFSYFDINTVYCVIPYILWLIFATALTSTIWKMNKDGVLPPTDNCQNGKC